MGAADLGPGNDILDSFDIQFAANSLHQGRVGPLLTWDPINDAPAGFVGDGATPHVVTGSPCLTNFFRIEGPDGIDVRTNDFVVQGKLSINFGLAVDCATYTRDGTGAGSIDVFASSVPEQTLVVDDGIGLTAMTGDGTGKYFASIPFDLLPAGITVTNVTDDPDTVLTPALTDLVTINSAEYNAGTLTVSAVASDSGTGLFALNPGSTIPSVLAVGSPMDVAVDYSPVDAGTDTGTLDIDSVERGLVSVPLSGTGSVAEIITVQRAQFRTAQNEWRIDGTTTVPGPGNIIHIHLGDAFGTELGDAEVDKVGGWSFRERNSPTLPGGATTVTVHSTGGAIVTVPLDAR